ncbi:MAG: flagellar hook-associated protein FlgK [Myxococcales bacterium]|nr:flagellar hook-associated protein FlgK [Myxococcales bacterium]|tara:strand:+ start:921 stop:2348 length:1428 start_codon:yes stop_codon:yes gene_type:complete
MLGLKNTLRNAASGMNTSQAGLATVGHNLANADTDGYSRQQVHIGNRGPLRIISGSQQISQAGQGATVQNIQRAHSTFLERQLLRDRMERGFFQEQSQGLKLFERLFDDQASNTIGPAVDEFFNAARDLSQEPHRFGNRQMFMLSADNIARSFNEFAQQAHSVREDADRTVQANVERINELAEIITATNARIGTIEAVGITANDFRDQRDIAIKEIAELADVRVLIHRDGGAQIDLANGFSLVQGSNRAVLSTIPDPANAGLLAIEHTSLSGVTTEITNSIQTGEIGGLLNLRDTVIPTHMGEMDQLAFTFVAEVNAIHQAGVGLDGLGGRDLFDPIGAVAGASLSISVNQAIEADPGLIAAAIDPAALPGDNRNLLALADLQTAPHAVLTNVTFNHFYSEIIRSVGAGVNRSEQLSEFHQTRFEQSDSLRESIEGVSIDDEMVDLSRFQKHFEASARVMDTVNRLMDELMQLVR